MAGRDTAYLTQTRAAATSEITRSFMDQNVLSNDAYFRSGPSIPPPFIQMNCCLCGPACWWFKWGEQGHSEAQWTSCSPCRIQILRLETMGTHQFTVLFVFVALTYRMSCARCRCVCGNYCLVAYMQTCCRPVNVSTHWIPAKQICVRGWGGGTFWTWRLWGCAFHFIPSADIMAQLVECVPNFSEGRNKEVDLLSSQTERL